ncbi:ester cyclase [Geodermatophilus sp. SYSU D00815]
MAAPAARHEDARRRWNAGDLPGYLELRADDLRSHGASPEPMDEPSAAEFYRAFWSALGSPERPDPQLVFHEVLVDGDLLGARTTVTGEHRGEFLGVPATGRMHALPGITFMRFRGDQVVERWTTMDFLGLMVRRGGVPAPVRGAARDRSAPAT